MSTKGIRISDLKENKCIPLREILAEIPNASQPNWALLWLDVTPLDSSGSFFIELENKVNKSKNGFPCTFETLFEISKKIFQEIEVLIIGCSNKGNIHRYKDDQKMYETCDIVIEMIDGGFWEIFSKDTKWIDRLAKKYEKVELLTPDFQKEH
ncbi:MAG: hypothetical protein SNF33_02435 [Candidatus Algichlamydia australiensis]|nr:hypothetical protein [Chlamydiales bacterium]